MSLHQIPEVDDHPRIVPVEGLNAVTVKRDPVEPVPIGTYVAKVFRVTGYITDSDGSLLARMECVDRDGQWTGWEPAGIDLYPNLTVALDSPEDLWRAAI